MIKVSADQKTKQQFSLAESVSEQDAERILQSINQGSDRQYRATIENGELVVRRLLID